MHCASFPSILYTLWWTLEDTYPGKHFYFKISLSITREIEKLTWERGSPSEPSELQRAFIVFCIVLYGIKSAHLPEPRADNSACTCCDCLALTELTRLSEPQCLHGGGWPCHRKRVSLAEPTFCHVNGLASFDSPRVAWVGEWHFYSGQVFFT